MKKYSTLEPHLHRERRFLKEFTVKVKRIDETTRRNEVALFVFSDVVMLCRKSGSKKALTTKLKIFRPPIPLRLIKLQKLKETAAVLMVVVDECDTLVDAHVIIAENPAKLDSLISTVQNAAVRKENRKDF